MNDLTIIFLGKVCSRVEKTLEEGSMHFFECKILNAVNRPIHVMADTLDKYRKKKFTEKIIHLHSKVCSENVVKYTLRWSVILPTLLSKAQNHFSNI